MTTAQISAAQVKQLREATQAGMMECKRALEETGGDFDAAVKLLREKGIAKAGKLGARETTEGRVAIATDGNVGAIVEVGCNTDFVAKNDDFGAFVQSVAQHVLAHAPADVAELLTQPWSEGGTVEDARTKASASTGENVVINRIARFDAADGVLGTYLHGSGMGAQPGVLVHVSGPATDQVRTFAAEVAKHVAAAQPRPQFLTRDEVPAELVASERDIFIKQAEDKPEEIRAKIADGKLNKWYSDVVLLEQAWIFGKDRIGKDVTIAEYAKLTGEQAGGDVRVSAFARYAAKD